MKPLRAIIVDDEPLARKRLRILLRSDPDLELIGECGNAADAVEAIRLHDPDLVLLDVKLPERDGFSIIDEIGASSMPFVLFVTAYDRHAVRAFDVEAIDYLVKPFTNQRFHAAMRRAKELIAAAEALGRWRDAMARVRQSPVTPDQLTIKQGDHFVIIDLATIDFVTAEGNYVRIHCGGRSYLLRSTIEATERLLAMHRFRRTHRSTLVNMRRIDRIERALHGDFTVVLSSGIRLRLSRRYRHNVPGL